MKIFSISTSFLRQSSLSINFVNIVSIVFINYIYRTITNYCVQKRMKMYLVIFVVIINYKELIPELNYSPKFVFFFHKKRPLARFRVLLGNTLYIHAYL